MPQKHSALPYKLVIRGQTYHLEIRTHVNGQRLLVRESTHCKDRKQAEQYAAKRFAQVIEQAEYRTNPLKLKDFTIDEAFGLYWEEIGQDHSNADDTFNKLSNLTKYFNPKLKLSTLTVDDISRFVKAKRAEGRKVATINRYLAMLSAILNLCKKRKVNVPDLNVREFMKPEPFENVKYFDDWATVEKIISNAADHFKPIILFSIYSGMRISAILNLKWSDIKGETFNISVKDKRFKGGRIVTKQIYPPMREVLDSLPKVNEYVFTYKKERILSVKKAWKRALERAGLPHVSLHTLRHTHATWFYQKTHDIKAVQKSLNHTSSKTTEKYAHLMDAVVYDEYMSVFGH
ncbi:MAG: site-specific integrase [Alphaproteobacteria bacterium]|nr:site-specific integrase [Alphaproteobacteria bacterium]